MTDISAAEVVVLRAIVVDLALRFIREGDLCPGSHADCIVVEIGGTQTDTLGQLEQKDPQPNQTGVPR